MRQRERNVPEDKSTTERQKGVVIFVVSWKFQGYIKRIVQDDVSFIWLNIVSILRDLVIASQLHYTEYK